MRVGVAKEDSSESVRSEFPDLPAKLQEYLMNGQDRFNSNLFLTDSLHFTVRLGQWQSRKFQRFQKAADRLVRNVSDPQPLKSCHATFADEIIIFFTLKQLNQS